MRNSVKNTKIIVTNKFISKTEENKNQAIKEILVRMLVREALLSKEAADAKGK